MGGHGPQPDFAFLMIPMLSEMWLHISTFHTSRSLASMPRRQAAASPARRPLPRAGEALASWPAPRAPSVPRAAVLFAALAAPWRYQLSRIDGPVPTSIVMTIAIMKSKVCKQYLWEETG